VGGFSEDIKGVGSVKLISCRALGGSGVGGMGWQDYQGATTIGLVCKGGIILASEKRVTWGNMLTSRGGMKVFKLNNRIGLAFAGLMSDMQALTREVSAYAQLYELENNRPIGVKAMGKLVSNMLFQRRMYPLLMETLVGGVDEEGVNLFSMDPVGSLIPDPFITAGTGAAIAMGVIEAEYKDGMSMKEGADLALKAIKAAVARDIASGDGVDMLIITKDGVEERSISLRK
jgi:proteasome beta subunit